MTTGRINQVTIVRRGWPTARISGRKSCLATGQRTFAGTAPAAARPAGPDLPRKASTFPLSIPQSAVGRYSTAREGEEYRLSAPRGDRGPEVQLFSVPRGRVSPDAL